MTPTRSELAHSRFGLRLQLMLAMGLLAALLVAVALTAFLSLAQLANATSQTVEVEDNLNRIANDVVNYTQLCRRYEKDIFLTIDDRNSRSYYLLAWQGAFESLDSSVTAFSRAATMDQDRQQALMWQMQLQKYHSIFFQIRTAIESGVIATPQAANQALAPYKDDIETLTTTALTVAQLKAVRAQQASAALLASASANTRLVLAISALALVIALVWSLRFPALMMRPIAALDRATTQLATGDLAARVGLRRADELGVLGRRFDDMAATIQQRTSDLEEQQARANSARVAAEIAHAAIAEQIATIAEQRAIIREMSVPILPLSSTALVLPLVGSLDGERLDMVQEQVLCTIEQTSAHFLIIDTTGVPIVDTQVAHGLIQVVQAARLLGAEVVLVGIRPEVAQAIVGLGIQMHDVITRSTLQSGIEYVLEHQSRGFQKRVASAV